MTLNEFKEKLFKKANGMSVSIDYNGQKYSVNYFRPNKKGLIQASVQYPLESDNPNRVVLGMVTEDDKIFTASYDPLIDNQPDFTDFLDKVEELGVLDD